ncbi:MAG: SprT family zinc-dependent metalloprotease [Pseudomonadota bacterium]
MPSLLQLALDFFGGGATPATTEPGAVLRAARRKPAAAPPRPRISRPKALRAGDPAGQDTLDTGLPEHPRANREALLVGQRVAYSFQRSRRRTIGFSVGPEGLAVRAPGWVPLQEIDAALAEKAQWILRKLAEADARRGRQEQAKVVWADGACFPFLGRPVTVRLVPPAAGSPAPRRAVAVLRGGPEADDAETATAVAGGPWLDITLPAGEPAPDAVREAVRAWLLQEARRIFTERLDHFAPRLAVRWTRLTLTNARTRWGSAGNDGGIRLHWRLLHFRLEVVDYVVAHELAHLRHMNHSARFWATVATVVPDYAGLRGELRADTTPRWDS